MPSFMHEDSIYGVCVCALTELFSERKREESGDGRMQDLTLVTGRSACPQAFDRVSKMEIECERRVKTIDTEELAQRVY
jgi:hypothetical protein